MLACDFPNIEISSEFGNYDQFMQTTSTCLLVSRSVIIDVFAIIHRYARQPNDSTVAGQVVITATTHAKNVA